MRTRLVVIGFVVITSASACGSPATKIGGITSVNPTCVGLVHATGFCFTPPPGAPPLRVAECVRVTYTAKDYPVDVKVSKIVRVGAARHRDQCPAG